MDEGSRTEGVHHALRKLHRRRCTEDAGHLVRDLAKVLDVTYSTGGDVRPEVVADVLARAETFLEALGERVVQAQAGEESS